jgi:hypothetical protein
MENLKEIRNELLSLHKTLMDIERGNYEAKHGKVSNVQLLNLLFEDKNFTWLRDISILVAEIDELFAAKNGIDSDLAQALFQQAKILFDDSEHHQNFKSKYQANLDTETEVEKHHLRLQIWLKAK